MEMITSCLTQQLYQAQSSARSKNRSLSFLQSLKEITSSLIDNPTGGKYNIVDQDSEEFAIELFRTSEAKSLMLFLGYIEEEEQFVYNRCDESMSKLADCLKILETEIVHEEVRLNETDLNNDQSNKRSRTGCSSGLRQMFLSRHIQKEHDMTSRKNSAHQSDFSFNTSGYFHQSCSRRDNKRNRGSLREMFHKQDHDTKRLSPSGLNSRLL